MPIVGLTDQQRSRYPEVGVIRKGEKRPEGGKGIGKDLSYFRMDTQDASVQKLWNELYPKEPRELIITLPHRTVEENFSAWKEEWIASGLAHRCDGQFMVQQRDKKGEMVMFSDGDRKPCPGGCSIAGRLSVILPQMRRLSTVMVATSSKWDIINLTENLNALYDIKQSLMGIPIILRRVLKSISTPRGNGKRARQKSWLLQLEAAPGYVAAELEYRAHEALPRVHLPAIAAPKARIHDDHTWREWDPEVMAANGEDAPGPVIDAEPVLAETPRRVAHTAPAEAAAVEAPPFVADDFPEHLAYLTGVETNQEREDMEWSDFWQAAVKDLGFNHSRHASNALKGAIGDHPVTSLNKSQRWAILARSQEQAGLGEEE